MSIWPEGKLFLVRWFLISSLWPLKETTPLPPPRHPPQIVQKHCLFSPSLVSVSVFLLSGGHPGRRFLIEWRSVLEVCCCPLEWLTLPTGCQGGRAFSSLLPLPTCWAPAALLQLHHLLQQNLYDPIPLSRPGHSAHCLVPTLPCSPRFPGTKGSDCRGVSACVSFS